MNDGLITLEAEILTDSQFVADDFRRRSLGHLGTAPAERRDWGTHREPVRFYGWRSGLAIHDLFNRLSVERDGMAIRKNDLFHVSYPELREMGEKCRIVLDSYEASQGKGDRVSEALVPPPLAITVLRSGYRYDLFDYKNEIWRFAHLAETLGAVPNADKANYYYSWFTWV